MKLRNSTAWSDCFVRRMLAWCAKQIGFPVRKVRLAQFRNKTTACYSGHAWMSGRIVVSIGPESMFPVRADHREGMDNEVIADCLEALVAVTAHEVAHLLQYSSGRIRALKKNRMTELNARRQEVMVLREFRKNREILMLSWMNEPKAKEVKSVQEQRADNAQAMLDKWTKKAKLAQTKLRVWKRKVKYYERAIAAKKSQ